MRRAVWAVLISGRGSNLAAFLELRDEVDIRIVVSSRRDAHGLLRARRAGVPTLVTPLLPGMKKIDWEQLLRTLRELHVTNVALLGFMKVVPRSFIENFPPGAILNLHPSLLPAYPGLNSIERAFVDGAPIGATVHEVVEAVDAGRIICRRRSLNSEDLHGYSLPKAEFLVHIDEQRLMREALRRWKPAMSL